MEEEDEVRAWCRKNHLSEDTFQVLRQEGFTSLRLLRLLTPEEVDKWLKQPRLLPLAQSLALQHAVALLKSGRDGQEEAMDTTSSSVTTPPLDFTHQTTILGSSYTQQHHHHLQQQQQQMHHQPQIYKGQSTADDVLLGAAAAKTAAACAVNPSTFEEVEAALQSCGCVSEILPEEHYRFLLVGKTGSGKSTTGNSILGAELFVEDVAFDSRTNYNQLKRGTVNGKGIEIMDCPGLFDTHRTHEEISVDIVKAVACMHPGPHAILYVIRLGRYTEEEYEVYTRLKALFDEQVTRYVIVVFTGGDGLEKEGKGIEEVLRRVPSSLHKVLQECQHRVVVFNNVADDKRPYVQQLLHVVEQLLRSNGGGFYTCPRYAEVGQGMEEEVERRLQEMEREQLAHKPYVQELKKQALSAEDELQQERRLFDQREQERQLEAEAAEARAEAEMQALMEEMKTKDHSIEQQRAERDKLRERHEREREEWRKEMEQRREQEKKQLERKEREFLAATRKAEDEQKKFLEAKKKIYERKVAQMKDSIVKDEEPSFLDKFLGKIKGVLGIISSFFPSDAMKSATSLFKGANE